jgi:hypothetical protein
LTTAFATGVVAAKSRDNAATIRQIVSNSPMALSILVAAGGRN